jgi:hypothetical protein
MLNSQRLPRAQRGFECCLLHGNRPVKERNAGRLRQYGVKAPRSAQAASASVIPAWSAGIQANMDVSGSILAGLDAGYPCRHDEDLRFPVVWASVSLRITSRRHVHVFEESSVGQTASLNPDSAFKPTSPQTPGAIVEQRRRPTAKLQSHFALWHFVAIRLTLPSLHRRSMAA